MPVRGHSNVQGDRTMGATSTVTTAWLDNLEATFPGAGPVSRRGPRRRRHHRRIVRRQGAGAADPGRELRRRRARRAARAAGAGSLQVHPARRHQAQSHPLPPRRRRVAAADTRPHRQGSARGVRNSAFRPKIVSTVRSSHGSQRPISELQRSEPVIVAQLARRARLRAGGALAAFADDYAMLRDRIEQCQQGITAGFEDYNGKLGQRALRPAEPRGRTELAHRQRPGAFLAHAAARRYPVAKARKRARQRSPDPDDDPRPRPVQHDGLQPGRSLSDVIGDRRVIFLNPVDLAARGLRDGDRVESRPWWTMGRTAGQRIHRQCLGHPAGLRGSLLPGGQRIDRGAHLLLGHAHAGVQGNARAHRPAARWSARLNYIWSIKVEVRAVPRPQSESMLNRYVPLAACALACALAAPGALARDTGQDTDAFLRAEMTRNHIPGAAVSSDPGRQAGEAAGLRRRQPRDRRASQHRLALPDRLGDEIVHLDVADGPGALGNVRLDDPVSKYVSDAPASWSAITVRQLASHVSGMAPVPPNATIATVDQAVSAAMKVPLANKPGVTNAYGSDDFTVFDRSARTRRRYAVPATAGGADHQTARPGGPRATTTPGSIRHISS